MFGMGAGELIVIAIVALLFLGPEKLPEAAKTLSKGIRDFRKQSRELQKTLEDDEEIGGAIRDLKSALRGEEPRPRPQPQRTASAPASAGAITAAASPPAGATVKPVTGTSAEPAEADPGQDATGDTGKAPAGDEMPVIRPAAGTVAAFVLGRGPVVPEPAAAVATMVPGREAAERVVGEARDAESADAGASEPGPDKTHG